jgi:hypothetical protein
MSKKISCPHYEYVFDYEKREHVCEVCRMRWQNTGQPSESVNYVFDRLLGGGNA